MYSVVYQISLSVTGFKQELSRSLHIMDLKFLTVPILKRFDKQTNYFSLPLSKRMTLASLTHPNTQ